MYCIAGPRLVSWNCLGKEIDELLPYSIRGHAADSGSQSKTHSKLSE